MKKALSIILSATMLLTTLGIGFTAYADVLEEKVIDNFIENSCKVIREYDADKDFISEDENVSAYNSAIRYITLLTVLIRQIQIHSIQNLL